MQRQGEEDHCRWLLRTIGYFYVMFGQKYPVASPSDSFVIGKALVFMPTGNGAQMLEIIQSDSERKRPCFVSGRNMELQTDRRQTTI